MNRRPPGTDHSTAGINRRPDAMKRFKHRCDRIIGETGQFADEMRGAAERISASSARTSTMKDHHSSAAEWMSVTTDHIPPVADRMSTIAGLMKHRWRHVHFATSTFPDAGPSRQMPTVDGFISRAYEQARSERCVTERTLCSIKSLSG